MNRPGIMWLGVTGVRVTGWLTILVLARVGQARDLTEGRQHIVLCSPRVSHLLLRHRHASSDSPSRFPAIPTYLSRRNGSSTTGFETFPVFGGVQLGQMVCVVRISLARMSENAAGWKEHRVGVIVSSLDGKSGANAVALRGNRWLSS